MEIPNTIVVSADRNGSTAFMEQLIGKKSINGDNFVHLAEAFSQDPEKNQPNAWYAPEKLSPKDVIDIINRGTGKPVTAKVQITWANFNLLYLEISATRKIFLYRNLIDATISRCLAQKTGVWHRKQHETAEPKKCIIEEKFFMDRFNYRLSRYQSYIDSVLEWSTEVYDYDHFQFKDSLTLIRNPSHADLIENYHELIDLVKNMESIQNIEVKIRSQLTKEFRAITLTT